MTIIGKATIAFWLLALGYLGFYVYGLVMGVFSPGEMVGFTVAAVVVAVLYSIRTILMRRALRDHEHGDLMRDVHHSHEMDVHRSHETLGF